ncbi:MAG: AraC family transcriptional regulator [Dyadobacter sp.]|uniref:AraC family transcriptional regulator n=1 Tax=Dyadobacter sp. TaxID=1914288 RepID=UPI0032673FE9
MVTNYLMLPHPALRPFVKDYVLATSCGKQVAYASQWPASDDITLMFYLRDEPTHDQGGTDCSLAGKRSYITGLVTQYNGIVHFRGDYLMFLIKFKPDGFQKLTRIPTSDITNRMVWAEDVFGNFSKTLCEQLINAADTHEMASVCDRLFLSLLNRQKNANLIANNISFISNELNQTTQFLTVEEYARKANMSVRNFERRFSEQAGLSPRPYIQLLRFNNVLKMKMLHPKKSWAAISGDCGYFDQMHMIRAFKRYSNQNPVAFFEQEKKFERPSVNVFESDSITLGKLETNMQKENFKFVKRDEA